MLLNLLHIVSKNGEDVKGEHIFAIRIHVGHLLLGIAGVWVTSQYMQKLKTPDMQLGTV